LVREELGKLAAHKMESEKPGQTLQTTALVHEAWLRLTGDENARRDGRAHLFGAGAEAMRRILIANARGKSAEKHGAGLERVELDDAQAAVNADDTMLLRISEALEILAREDPRVAELVKLRFFIGLTNEQAAQAM